MRRFVSNRWCTFILALCVSLACIASISQVCSADARWTSEVGDGTTIGGSGNPVPPGAGDPDIPLPSAKAIQKGGAIQPLAQTSTSMRAAGDSRAWDYSVMMWRLRAVLQGLGLSYIRF